MAQFIYQKLGKLIHERAACAAIGDKEGRRRQEELGQALIDKHMPHHPRFMDIYIDWRRSEPEKIVLRTSYHAFGDRQYAYAYNRYRVTATPSFSDGCHVQVSKGWGWNCSDRVDIAHTFSGALMATVESAVSERLHAVNGQPSISTSHAHA